MMLRASIDVQPGPGSAGDRERRRALLERFVTAVVGDDAGAADDARAALVDGIGGDGLVDAAAVVGNFEMMTRIADGTGARLRDKQLDAAAEIIADRRLGALPSARW